MIKLKDIYTSNITRVIHFRKARWEISNRPEKFERLSKYS